MEELQSIKTKDGKEYKPWVTQDYIDYSVNTFINDYAAQIHDIVGDANNINNNLK